MKTQISIFLVSAFVTVATLSIAQQPPIVNKPAPVPPTPTPPMTAPQRPAVPPPAANNPNMPPPVAGATNNPPAFPPQQGSVFTNPPPRFFTNQMPRFTNAMPPFTNRIPQFTNVQPRMTNFARTNLPSLTNRFGTNRVVR